jgi:hypothetical protein
MSLLIPIWEFFLIEHYVSEIISTSSIAERLEGSGFYGNRERRKLEKP